MRSGLPETLSDVAARAATGIVARGRLEPPGLTRTLLRRLSVAPGTPDALVADPVYEIARVWANDPRSFGDLSGGLLHPHLVNALDGARAERMPRERHPYLHQVAAWEAAAAGRSCLVTSGTGSGKTECFMVPILDDLLRLAEAGDSGGVRGIVIYPLNALIESQRERLGAWTDGLKGKVSFALYNGLTPEIPKKVTSDLFAAELGDRRTIRNDPPSILVTNVTMLEYLLLRSQDLPILSKSQRKLRWIVLDEAHGYVGAQAAEMALLLRRVRSAFGVDPDDVRLMATSATISEGPNTRDKLTSFVADLAGIDTARVTVIEGKEAAPALPPISGSGPLDLASLRHRDPAELWGALAGHRHVRAVRDLLGRGPATLVEIGRLLEGVLPGPSPLSTDSVQELLDLAAVAANPEGPSDRPERLVPWR